MGQRSQLFEVKRLLIVSIIAYLSMAILGIYISLRTSSNALLADSLDSLINMLITMIVFLGIFYADRLSEENSNLNYFKIEVLSAFTVAIIAILLAGYIVYISINRFYAGYIIKEGEIAVLSAFIFGIISLIITVKKYEYAKKYGLLSLKIDSSNSIKDTIGSFFAALGIYLSISTFTIFDTIFAVIIATFLATASIPVIRESTLILLDVYNNPQLKQRIEELAKGFPHITRILSINFRRIGYKIAVEIELEVDGDIPVEDLHEISKKYEEKIKSRFPNIAKVLIAVKAVS
jgi:cation diffusion facilitator family transporter